MIPRIALALIFFAGALFAYTESTYMHDHAASLGTQSAPVSSWMWMYRAIAIACFFAASFFVGALFR